MGSTDLALSWKDHHGVLFNVFEHLLAKKSLVDCTLAAEGKFLKAHRIVLSACSPYFEALFDQEYDKHPIIFLRDVQFEDLKTLLEFVYSGEIKIPESRLVEFLNVAEALQIKGLGGAGNDGQGSTKKTCFEALRQRETSSPVPRKRSRRPSNSSDSNSRDRAEIIPINSETSRLQSSGESQVPVASSSSVPQPAPPAKQTVPSEEISVDVTKVKEEVEHTSQSACSEQVSSDPDQAEGNEEILGLKPEFAQVTFTEDYSDDMMPEDSDSVKPVMDQDQPCSSRQYPGFSTEPVNPGELGMHGSYGVGGADQPVPEGSEENEQSRSEPLNFMEPIVILKAIDATVNTAVSKKPGRRLKRRGKSQPEASRRSHFSARPTTAVKKSLLGTQEHPERPVQQPGIGPESQSPVSLKVPKRKLRVQQLRCRQDQTLHMRERNRRMLSCDLCDNHVEKLDRDCRCSENASSMFAQTSIAGTPRRAQGTEEDVKIFPENKWPMVVIESMDNLLDLGVNTTLRAGSIIDRLQRRKKPSPSPPQQQQPTPTSKNPPFNSSMTSSLLTTSPPGDQELGSQGNPRRSETTPSVRRKRKQRPPVKIQCPYCPRVFKFRSALTYHLRIHTGERPYACPLCGMQFRSLSTVKGHMRSHSKERAFTCETCGKTFIHRRNMREHEKVVHRDKAQSI